MFSDRSAHDRKVACVLMPLYTRIMKETARLMDYLQTIEGAGCASGSNTEVGQFAILYLRKILAELDSPRDFFRIGGARKLDFKPRRKNAAYTTRYIAENLHRLYERIDINDLHAYHAGSARSRLYNTLSYYRMALLVAANTLEGCTSQKRKNFSGNRTVIKRLHMLRVQSDRLVAIPVEVVDQYKEKAYLLANMDVRASLADGNITCGLEHFVLQGVVEAKQGGRCAPGIDLDLIADQNRTHTPDQLKLYMDVLESSGMFDANWYKQTYGRRKNPLLEYCQKGYLDGKAPNALFDQKWYCETYPDIRIEDAIPAFHYAQHGESEGRQPCERFDATWYRNHNKLNDADGLALVHYLKKGRAEKLNPNRYFDVAFYTAKNPDVIKAKIDPVDHYYRFGWLEERAPSANFDVVAYKMSAMGGMLDTCPVTHKLLSNSVGTEAEPPKASVMVAEIAESMTDDDLPTLSDIAGNIHYFSNPGPDFEGPSTIDCTRLDAKVKAIAFYLPQFHAFEHNDRWWGKGFSEWRNVARGTPRYSGHYQPRIPRDLGFYDLNDKSVLRRQSELALQNGIEAFCFYYYWFNGKRLMDMPINNFMEMDLDQEFCLMFANENWTRTWDGFDSEVLIEQDYLDVDEDAFIEDNARHMRHERYMRISDRPLWIIYRPGLLPDAKNMLGRWRDKWTESLGVTPWMMMAQGFGDEDPREFGLDGAIEFPPHKLCANIPNMHDRLNILDPNYEGYAKSYTDVIDTSLSEKPPVFPLVKTVVPHWDNDARREGRGFTMHGSTPELYEKWLQGSVCYAQQNPIKEESLVFINAWNEWAEGAYLEPDVHYGHAYLNATRRAVHGLTSTRDRQRLLLVGHDAYKHGAQMLLMSMAKIYARQFGMDVTILLKAEGPLVSEYREVCTTVLLEQLGESNLEGWARHQGFDMAIFNTSVTGNLVPALKSAGVKITMLIHELPNLIESYDLAPNMQIVAEQCEFAIFPSTIVQDGFNYYTSNATVEQKIHPQGIYMPVKYSRVARSEIRGELGIPTDAKVVLNVGFADLRKGFDIFLQIARQMIVERPDVHFIWAGAIEQEMQRWVRSDLDEVLEKRIHLIGFTTKMADYYSASDCLFLSSREDPYPSVVLEAMCVGTPVVIFKNATGFDSLISKYGQVVDRNDIAQINRSIVHCLYNDSRAEKLARAEYIDKECRFDDYCFSLLQMLKPDLKKVSIVVPNYNYEQYMRSRLTSIFDQTYPIFETLVLDDCSKDNSIAVIGDVAKDAVRVIELIENETNSGSVFHQWKKGMKASRGDYIWIAEADDLAEPEFIARSLETFSDNTALSFTNSKQIDTQDTVLAEDYNYYYRCVDGALFANDFRLEGEEFIKRALSIRNVIMNVSSVLWNREILDESFDEIGENLYDLSLVGDWRIYLEALGQKGRSVSYIADSLNVHRRHEGGVTQSLDAQVHLKEIEGIHNLIARMFDSDHTDITAMEDYINELKKHLGESALNEREAA